MEAYDTIEYRGFDINLYYDEDPQNPKEKRNGKLYGLLLGKLKWLKRKTTPN